MALADYHKIQNFIKIRYQNDSQNRTRRPPGGWTKRKSRWKVFKTFKELIKSLADIEVLNLEIGADPS